MPWPNARTCRQACHAAGLAPRLTAAQVLLVTVLVWMGSFPTVTRARGLQGADTAAPGLEDPPRNIAQQGGPSLGNQTGLEGRISRSLNVYDKFTNEKWLVSKSGFFLVIHQNGSVATTNEKNPRMGILVFSSNSIRNKTRPQLFSQLPTAHEYVTTIMGKESNRFLCINKTGKVYSQQNFTSECGFNATIQAHNFETYCQPFEQKSRRGKSGKRRKHTNRCHMKCLGISKRGKIRNSKRVCFTEEHAKMTTINVNDNQPVSKPFPGLTMPETTPRPGTQRPRPSKLPRPTKRPKPPKKEPCRGLFCKSTKKDGERRRGEGRRRKNRGPERRGTSRRRRRNGGRNGRRRNKDRQRRARGGTPGEEGPLSDVT